MDAGRAATAIWLMMLMWIAGCAGSPVSSDSAPRPTIKEGPGAEPQTGLVSDWVYDDRVDPGLWVEDGQAVSLSDFRARETARQSFVSACMRELGFDYIEFLGPEPQLVTMQHVLGLPSLSSDGRWSYGFVDEYSPSLELPTDPNLTVLDGLSASERSAWEAAMSGDAAPGELGESGCLLRSVMAVYDDVDLLGLTQALNEIVRTNWSEFESTESVVRARAQWEECVLSSVNESTDSAVGSRDEALTALRGAVESSLRDEPGASGGFDLALNQEERFAIVDLECFRTEAERAMVDAQIDIQMGALDDAATTIVLARQVGWVE